MESNQQAELNFGGDDLDDHFPEEAVDAFVQGMHVDLGDADEAFLAKMSAECKTAEGRDVFAAVLIENDDMLKGAILGAQDQAFTVDKERTGVEAAALLTECSLAGHLITDDKDVCMNFINDRFQHFGDKFGADQLLLVAKSLMNQHAKARTQQAQGGAK